MDIVNIVYRDTLASYQNGLEEVLTMYSLIETLILLFWLLTLAVGSSVLMAIFLQRLSVDNWKTRSMLNMIPNEVISHNRALKSIFLDKKIVQTT